MISSVAKAAPYYVRIDGKNYDRAAIGLAEKLANDKGISAADAKRLAFALVRDGTFAGPVFTNVELATANYIRKNYAFTGPGREAFDNLVPSSKGTGYYKTVQGVKVDAAAWDTAIRAQKAPRDGRISAADSMDIVSKLTKDGTFAGPVLTPVERNTAELIRATQNFTPKGRRVFDAEIPMADSAG
jgi:hypothetical protein